MKNRKQIKERINEIAQSIADMQVVNVQENRSMTEVEAEKMADLQADLIEAKAELRAYDEALKTSEIKTEEMGTPNMEIREALKTQGVELSEMEVRAMDRTEAGLSGQLKETMATEVMRKMGEQAVLLQHVNMQTIDGTKKLPILANSHKAAICAENEQFAEKDYDVTFKTAEAVKLAQFSVVSKELLEDSELNITGIISGETAGDYARKLEDLLVNGNVDGKTEGIFNAEGAKEVIAAAVDYNALVDAYYSLPAEVRQNVVFVTNNAGVRTLRKLVDGNKRPLLETSTNAITGKGQDVVFGAPVIELSVAQLPAGVHGAFVDFGRAMFVGVGRKFNIERNDSIRCLYDQAAFVSSMRFTSIVKDAEAICVLKQA